MVQDLKNQGYESLPEITNQERMLANVRVQLQKLNAMQFTNSEWQRFVLEYLDKPSDSLIDKTEKDTRRLYL